MAICFGSTFISMALSTQPGEPSTLDPRQRHQINEHRGVGWDLKVKVYDGMDQPVRSEAECRPGQARWKTARTRDISNIP